MSNNTQKPADSAYAPVATADCELLPDVQAAVAEQCVELVAPSDMQGGYSLNVTLDGKQASVTVPVGGVLAGETFLAQLEVNSETTNKMDIPVGHWRDGTYDCWNLGLCHPHWLLSWCFPSIALGQVMTRFNVGVCDKTETNRSRRSGATAFRHMFIIFLIYFITMRVLSFALRRLTTYGDVETNSRVENGELLAARVGDWMDFVLVIYLGYMAIRTRAFLDGPKSLKTVLSVFFGFFVAEIAVGFLVGVYVGAGDALDQQANPSLFSATATSPPVVQISPAAQAVAALIRLLSWSWWIFIVVVGVKTRKLIRNKYAIPAHDCGEEAQDVCCMIWCSCCTIAQMTRHTADHTKYSYEFGEDNGLDEDAPEIDP